MKINCSCGNMLWSGTEEEFQALPRENGKVTLKCTAEKVVTSEDGEQVNRTCNNVITAE